MVVAHNGGGSARRCHVLLIALLCGILGCLLHLTHKSSASMSPLPVRAPTLVRASLLEPPQASKAMVPETLVDKRVVRAGSDLWRLEIWSPPHEKDEIDVEDSLRIFKNDHLVRKANALEFGGVSLEFGKATFATHFPLIVIRAEPAAGHPGPVNLLSIRKGQLVAIGRVGGEAGGPLFRDYDGDGKKEWVFDDYDYYLYRGARPKFFLVYKEAADGKLKLWKRLPNKKRRRLPNNLGLDWWDN